MSKLSFTNDYIFYTVQGEGVHTGVPSVFLRLSGCNLRCEWRNSDGGSSLCDTPYSSHQPEKLIKTIDEVLFDLKDIPCRFVVITGGEPYLQKNLAELVSRLKDKDYTVCIETNGSLYFDTKADFASISPKLSSSCIQESKNYESHEAKRISYDALTQLCLNHDFQLKFVLNEESELKEIEKIWRYLEGKGVSDPRSKVLLMPQAVTKTQLEKASEPLIVLCKKHSYRFCDRMHIRVWGDDRGV